MRVHVKLFATLRRYVEGATSGVPFEVELPDGATIADLIGRLHLPTEEVKMAFVNGRARPEDWHLESGDEIGIFPPIGGGQVTDITVDTWLYGELARYGGQADRGSHANLQIRLPAGSTLGDLLARLNMPTEARGITFINGQLSAMPGLQPDLGHVLSDGDRVALFHPQSMWPFQYRHGVAMVGELSNAMQASKDGGLHHSYKA